MGLFLKKMSISILKKRYTAGPKVKNLHPFPADKQLQVQSKKDNTIQRIHRDKPKN